MFFRERNKIDITETMQIDSLDQPTKNNLYTIFTHHVNNVFHSYQNIYNTKKTDQTSLSTKLSLTIASICNIPLNPNSYFKAEKLTKIFKEDYSYVFELIERTFNNVESKENYEQHINKILEKGNSNYRFSTSTEGQFIKVYDIKDLENLENAMNTTVKSADEHMKSAIQEFSKRNTSRNYITVCVEAVEAMVKKNLGDKFKDKPLSSCWEIQKKLNIPNIIIAPIKKLIDESNQAECGIRHSKDSDLNNSTIISEAEAYYILTSCANFINYLKRKR